MRAQIRNGIVGALRAGFRLSGSRGRRLMSAALAEEGNHVPCTVETVNTKRGPITFYCLGDLPLWRVQTLTTKEPETLEWIDSFGDDDVLWDIGANVGIYTLYAATGHNVRVLAFEPSAVNYTLLNRNIEMNGLDGRVQAYCVAFSEKTGLDALNMQNTEFGGALSSFGEAVDNHGKHFKPSFRQFTVGYSIDDFIARFNPLFPNHIKIDVDGIEDKIVAGAAKTLSDPRLKSVSVELDASRETFTQPVIAAIESAGLKLHAKRHGEMFDEGEYTQIFNYQFRR